METVIRVILIYLAILLGLRILGKREFGQLSPLELITVILIPELVAQAVVREDFSFTNAMIALCTLFSLVFVTSLLRYKFMALETVLSGEPSVLVSRGEFVKENLNKERVDAAEIFGAMHESGVYRLEQVKWAILETDGKIAIVPEEEDQNVVMKKPKQESMA